MSISSISHQVPQEQYKHKMKILQNLHEIFHLTATVSHLQKHHIIVHSNHIISFYKDNG